MDSTAIFSSPKVAGPMHPVSGRDTTTLPPGDRGFLLARAALSLLLGLAALARPPASRKALTLLAASFVLMHGALAFACGLREALRLRHAGSLVFEGIVGIAAAALVAAGPGITWLLLPWVVAGWAVLSGGALAATALEHGPQPGRAALFGGGVLAAAWGMLLIAGPELDVPGTAQSIGAFALLFGLVLLGVAEQLRRAAPHDAAPPAAASLRADTAPSRGTRVARPRPPWNEYLRHDAARSEKG